MIRRNQKPTISPTNNDQQCAKKTLSSSSFENDLKTNKAQHLQSVFSCAESALEHYNCDRCSYKTLFIVNLKRHVKKTHYIKTRGYFKEDELEKMLKTCRYKTCSFITYSRLVFLKHVQDRCIGRLKALERLNIPLTNESALVEDDNNWFKCDQCPYKTESNFFLIMHISAEHGATGKRCDNQQVVNVPEEVVVETEEVKLNPCEERENVLSLVEDQGSMTTRCRFCFYEAKDTSDLRKHFLSDHTETTHDNKNYSCKKCHYVTRSKKGVQIHMKMKHKEVRCYPCPYCSFKGQKPSSLEQHMWKRYAEHIEWFSCEKCSYKTIFEDALKVHRDDHERTISKLK